jgi:hypothetical protein
MKFEYGDKVIDIKTGEELIFIKYTVNNSVVLMDENNTCIFLIKDRIKLKE